MAVSSPTREQLSQLLPLDNAELDQILSYTRTLPKDQATRHLTDLLGDSPEAAKFIQAFGEDSDVKVATPATTTNTIDIKSARHSAMDNKDPSTDDPPPSYAPPAGLPPALTPRPTSMVAAAKHRHTNKVIEAAHVRARDEQEMQQALQNLQYQYGIYNSDIEPEHGQVFRENMSPRCASANVRAARKWNRYGVQDMWSRAVMYPGEKAYNDNPNQTVFSSNPYRLRVVSPFGYGVSTWGGVSRPVPCYHAQAIHQSIQLNNSLNQEAQAKINDREPKLDIWDKKALDTAMANLTVNGKKVNGEKAPMSRPDEKRRDSTPAVNAALEKPKASRLSSFRKSIGIKSSDERAVAKVEKAADKGNMLRDEILAEENGRWPDEQWRYIVAVYQDKVGMTGKIAQLRAHQPTQYLHLLRAGYFEPIPVAWATQASNPLKFSIEASSGWRGITPAWRGYEDTAEERLYWVLNHREGSVGMRMKPDFISEMNMARARMATAVDPPPLYFSADDTCHLQHTSEGYSKQVMPPPFHAYDRPETPTDDTMILLDVSGSMDFDPVRPIYEQFLITRWTPSTQPKNKDVAKAIIRRFTDAMANHDHQFTGYDLTTFSDKATFIGSVNHRNLNDMWHNVRLGGGTRVMTGWQKVKERHFQKHSESATYHPVYGWQAGPETPMLRLLLLLDGEATDMDEFELDLLGLSWAHVTIFLIGVDGCPHHHRHANELQRIGDVNHHVSFVDAQGNTPERFVTHELLKRHLGYDIPLREFTEMEELPAYSE
ncbi:hypothetical protein LTR56_003350 [Elasticomyces elasticus]|nr:hypothetical protein LTR56_003350 [Elasticomyces elasticus]KAK3664232.1 hypothetical protein LTR22_004930 [Elasticomyces elasticus]KAK4931447.1 hypothetical protein LTR49_002148 [Elasticomyces elasticus]KAK5766033.1 hypothetical protein LTS12_003779 [Elasticomyces elasticus]